MKQKYSINVYDRFTTIVRISDGEIVAALYSEAQKSDVKIREIINAAESEVA